MNIYVFSEIRMKFDEGCLTTKRTELRVPELCPVFLRLVGEKHRRRRVIECLMRRYETHRIPKLTSNYHVKIIIFIYLSSILFCQ